MKRGIRIQIDDLQAYYDNFMVELKWRMSHPDWPHNKKRIPQLQITMTKLQRQIQELQRR